MGRRVWMMALVLAGCSFVASTSEFQGGSSDEDVAGAVDGAAGANPPGAGPQDDITTGVQAGDADCPEGVFGESAFDEVCFGT